MGGEHSLKFQLPSSWFGCNDVLKVWRKRITYSISDEAVYRTALATPGLLITRLEAKARLQTTLLNKDEYLNLTY